MNKTNVVEIMKEMKIKFNEESKHYVLTESKFNKLIESEKFDDTVKVVRSKKNTNLIEVRGGNGFKTTLVILEITKTTRNKNEKSEKTENNGGNGHKTKNSSYIIKFKKFDDKKETIKTDLSSCAEIKAWMKTISKKQMEYLKIYDNYNNECRKSAWIEREQKQA